MKKYTRYMLICIAALTLSVTGCGSKNAGDTTKDTAAATTPAKTEAPTATPTLDPATADANGGTVVQNEADDSSALGEGSNMVGADGSVNVTDAKKNEIGKEITLSKDGKELYTITIDSVVLTQDRNDFQETQPDQVAKVTFTYKNIAADSLLIDSYSFILQDADGSACQSYALVGKDETMPIAAGESLTRTIAYALNTSGKDVTLFYNASSADGSFYEFPVTLEDEK